MKHFIGVIDTNSSHVHAKVRKMDIAGASRVYPALSFFADDQRDAETYFTSHYHHLFQLDLEPADFTVTERA